MIQLTALEPLTQSGGRTIRTRLRINEKDATDHSSAAR